MTFKANLNGKLILIVDEDRNSGSILSAKLLNGGYSSTYVKSCKSAIDLIVTDGEHFDAILVSLNSLSDEYLNFPKTLRSAAKNTNTKLPPIAAYSAQKTGEFIKSAITSGYIDFIIRPVEPDVLWEKVSRIIDQDKKIDSEIYKLEISESASATFDIEVVSINEVGITFFSTTNLDAGLVMSISTPFLESLGLNQTNLRVFHREPLSKPHNDKRFKVEAHFISISPKDAVAIRKATIDAAKKKVSV